MKRCGSSLTACLLGMALTLAHAAAPDPMTYWAISEAVATQSSAQAADNLRRVLAIWIGRDASCDIVAVETSVRPGVSYSYRVCGDVVEEIPAVPPAAPVRDPTYRRMLSDAIKRALLHGAVTDWYAGYRIRARRTGLPRQDGCSQVETIVTHGPLLVERAMSTACP